MMGRVALGQKFRVLIFAAQEHAIPGYEDLIEHAHCGGLTILVAEDGLVRARPPGRARDDGQALRIYRYRAGDGEVAILGGHGATGQHQQLMHIGRRSDDGLGARDHHAARLLADDVHIGVRIVLLVRAQAAIALRVGHGDADGQIAVLYVFEIGTQARVVFAAVGLVETMGELPGGVQTVHAQVTHGAAGFLADQPRVFELGQQILAAAIERQEAVDLSFARSVRRERERRMRRIQRVIVGHTDGVDAGREARLVGDAGDKRAIDVHPRRVAAQGFAILSAGHQHGVSAPRSATLTVNVALIMGLPSMTKWRGLRLA